MEYTILADFGSTYTKLCVFDLNRGELVMTTRHPSTVKTDAAEGLLADLETAQKRIGADGVNNAQILASSSAAGGLRMVVVGLTPRYSLTAGINVALGSGARVIKTYSLLLTEEDIREIEAIQPEILLLCGGVEDGNAEWIIQNAKRLSKSARLFSPVIYAGNRQIAHEVRSEFLRMGKECFVAENVFPSLSELNAGPAGEVIRNIFMNRITGMKGLGKVKSLVGEIVMPTPAAVLEGGRLLSEGLPGKRGLGTSLIFDVGGATTDVYSFVPNSADNVKIVGSPEPESKRTVEGDLGLRSSAVSLSEAANVALISAELQTKPDAVLEACRFRSKNEDYIPDSDFERRLDFALASCAVHTSARRHAGKILNAYAKGAREIQEGKNLSDVKNIVGTGGPIINSIDPEGVMKNALKKGNEKAVLLPEHSTFYLDREYLLYAVGLASAINKEGALEIALGNIRKV
ncbi:MAG: glutamate mutase L [Oscillospiraceae bacterium]